MDISDTIDGIKASRMFPALKTCTSPRRAAKAKRVDEQGYRRHT